MLVLLKLQTYSCELKNYRHNVIRKLKCLSLSGPCGMYAKSCERDLSYCFPNDDVEDMEQQRDDIFASFVTRFLFLNRSFCSNLNMLPHMLKRQGLFIISCQIRLWLYQRECFHLAAVIFSVSLKIIITSVCRFRRLCIVFLFFCSYDLCDL